MQRVLLYCKRMHTRNVQLFGKFRYRVHIGLQIRKHLRAFKRQHYVRKAAVGYGRLKFPHVRRTYAVCRRKRRAVRII